MCGIWAIINQKEEPFDYQSFCTLGCANDRRGGDSCGVFIDGKVEYGIGQKSKFEDFFWSSDLLNNTENAIIALGHDRKASVGGISLEKAHPIILSEKIEGAEGEEPKEIIKFVLIHNGTIYNYEDLAKKYIPDIDIKDMSDSQVLARLLYYSGYDFLAEYNGGAAFVAVDYRDETPKILIWRGESKRYAASSEMEEERPLFCNYENGRLVISSIPSYLHIVDGNCFIVPENAVLQYDQGQLWTIKKIDRTKAQQNKIYEYVNRTHTNTTPMNTIVWLRVMDVNNTYKIETKLADGKVRLSNYGRVLDKLTNPPTGEPAHVVYFFNGIALKEERAYKFLYKAWKQTKLNLDDFTRTYQNFIRYFSVDQLYFEGQILMKAIEPFKREEYTGYLHMLTEATKHYYISGRDKYEYITDSAAGSFLLLNAVRDYNYKLIWKEFIQSMG